MIHHSIIGPWRQGKLLSTGQTRDWTPEQRAQAQAIEETMVFSGFTYADQGRARVKVCTVPDSSSHGSASATARLIASAPQLLEALWLEQCLYERRLPTPYHHDCEWCFECVRRVHDNTRLILGVLNPTLYLREGPEGLVRVPEQPGQASE